MKLSLNISRQVCQIGLFLSLLALSPVAHAQGDKTGGGGDETEMQVRAIRLDILNWIQERGAESLTLAHGISYEFYQSQMIKFLQSDRVIVSFTEDQKKVLVNGKEKTCRSFRVDETESYHIICHINRFIQTSPAGQYRLVHHEYAGLAGVEQNREAASDYSVSNQLIDFLVPEVSLKLAIKRNYNLNKPVPGDIPDLDRYLIEKGKCKVQLESEAGQQFMRALGFKPTSSKTPYFHMPNGKVLVVTANDTQSVLSFQYGQLVPTRALLMRVEYDYNGKSHVFYDEPGFIDMIKPDFELSSVAIPSLSYRERIEKLPANALGEIKELKIFSDYFVDERATQVLNVLINLDTHVPTSVTISTAAYTQCLKDIPSEASE